MPHVIFLLIRVGMMMIFFQDIVEGGAVDILADITGGTAEEDIIKITYGCPVQ
jgi:hypothetical protein